MTGTTPPTPDPDAGAPGPYKQTEPGFGAPRKVAAQASRYSMADLLIGTVLADRYRLQKRIGEGAMGWVFLAEHTEIGKRCAVKVLRPSLCRVPEAVSRFRREARSASQIGSRHIVDITDFGTTETGAAFYVMEMLEGRDLQRVIKKKGAMPWQRVQSIGLQLCDALQAAHDQGIIHRDVKPANVYLQEQADGSDFIKVLDFGIARLASPKDSVVTATGVVMGTPDYMAPEQAQGQHVDHRADVYSLGATLYAMLTGRPPFIGKNEYDVIYKQLNSEPEPPSKVAPQAGIAPWFEAVVLQALRKDPETRIGTMNELAEALRAPPPAAAAPPAVRPEALPTEGSSSTRPRPKQSSPGLAVALVVGFILFAIAGGVGFALFFR